MLPTANRTIRATNDTTVPYWCSSNRCRIGRRSLSFTASPSVLGNCYATLGSVANRTAGLRSSLTLTGSRRDHGGGRDRSKKVQSVFDLRPWRQRSVAPRRGDHLGRSRPLVMRLFPGLQRI